MVEPAPGMPEVFQGFRLNEDGSATSIQMATLQYESWKREGELLILYGKSIGNRQTFSFTDTLKVEKLTETTLVLKRKEQLHTYLRTGEDFTTLTTTKLVPTEKIKTVKGILKMGHEVRTFRAENDTQDYWVVDTSLQLNKAYNEIIGEVNMGTPVYVELEVIDKGKTDEGFAASYDGVYHVAQIKEIKEVPMDKQIYLYKNDRLELSIYLDNTFQLIDKNKREGTRLSGNINYERGYKENRDATLYILQYDKPEEAIYFVRLTEKPGVIMVLDKNKEITEEPPLINIEAK